jgi:hypothetical protein
VLVALLASAAGSPSSSRRSATAAPFQITHLVLPLYVKQNGPRGTRKVYWQGQPTFPVTVHEHGICPESVNCGPRNAVGWGTPPAATTFTTSLNPLVNTGLYHCEGNLTSNYVIGVEIWLTDAKGHRTPAVRDFWVCKTH